ncbi:MAG: hypothetical protein HY000_13840 [Planctomycetes bacterium]|nr:hypothetical protein [Planctomycetota bacterium]
MKSQGIAWASLLLACPLWLARIAAEQPAKPGPESAPAWVPLRIENRIYRDAPTPESETLTLFHQGKAYDYIDALGEVTIFEPAGKCFVVFDPGRQLAAEVALDEIEQRQSRARAQTRSRLDELAKKTDETSQELVRLGRFLLEPQFNETYDDKAGALTFASPYLVYRIHAIRLPESAASPQDQQAGDVGGPDALAADAAAPGAASPGRSAPLAQQLRDYWDWHARLNQLLNPRSLPPQPRLAVNASLFRRKLVPTEVELSIHIGQAVRLRTTHEVGWQLSADDLRRLKQTDNQLRSSRFVSLEELLRENRSQ